MPPIHAAGRQCGSPALRREQFCYFHHTTRRPKPYPGKFRHLDAHEPFELPVVEDRASGLSVASQILCRIASNDLDPERAGRLLYSLQVVACLLPREVRAANPNDGSSLPETAAQPTLVEELVDDETHGPIAPIAEYIPPATNPVTESAVNLSAAKNPCISPASAPAGQPPTAANEPPPVKPYSDYTTAEANHLSLTIILRHEPLTRPRPDTLTFQDVQNHLNARRKQDNLPPKQLTNPAPQTQQPATPGTLPTLQAVAAPPPLHWKTNVHANRPSRPQSARLSHRSRRQVHLSPLRPAGRPR